MGTTSFLLCLLGGALLTSRAADPASGHDLANADKTDKSKALPALKADKANNFLTATFKPGKLGVGADWNSGRVTRVDKGGQGERNKIEVGMIIKTVDGKTYHERLLDKRIAGKDDFELTFFKPPPAPTTTPGPPKEPDAPPKPDFIYTTELDPSSFKELVYKVTNGTKQGEASKPQPYYPVVMFHMSWCKHCKHSLPEIEKAAKMLEEERKRNIHEKQIWPKFFVLECDGSAENQVVCDMYGKSSWPVIRAFRDHRSYLFNRPRMAQTFAWWAMHLSRPPIVEIQQEPDYQQGPVFMLHASMDDATLINIWMEVALDNLENFRFAYVRPGAKFANKLPPPPSVTVKGEGLEPLPLDGPMTREALTRWVNFNQFAPVAELSPYSESALKNSGFVVVALMYRSDDKKSKALGQFDFKARQMRTNSQFLFAAIDVSKEDNKEYISQVYPLLNWPVSDSSTRLFAFDGKDSYWESPSLVDAAELTMESIGSLLSSSEAHTDKSTYSGMFHEKRKFAMRYATGSPLGMLIAVTVLPTVLWGMWICISPLFASDEASTKSHEDPKKVD